MTLDVIDSVFPGIESSLRDGSTDFYIGPMVDDVSAALKVEKVLATKSGIFCRKGHPPGPRQIVGRIDSCGMDDIVGHRQV